VPGTGTTTTRYVSHEATIRAWLRRALAEVVTSAPADISRLASYTVRPSPYYTTGMEHSPTSATGTGWKRTPWHATQRAAWEALERAGETD
jgi:hypothetical protein